MPLKIATKAKQPERFYVPERDGVSFSTLSKFMDCREKARLHLQGWTPISSSMALTFGGIVHKIDEWVRDDIRSGKLTSVPTVQHIRRLIKKVEKLWHKENPRARAQELEYLELSLLFAEGVMPQYFQYWYKDYNELKWEKVEGAFHLPYVAEDRQGRQHKTFLKGRIDASFRLKRLLYLFETKTKSRVEDDVLADILPFEIQANIYLSSLRKLAGEAPRGLLYNIIRRPSLRQKKSESLKAFADRVAADVKERPDWYFIRMEMTVDEAEIDAFEGELEDLVSDFLLWWAGEAGHYKDTNHCQNKYGLCPFIGLCLRKDKTNYFKRDYISPTLQEW